MTATETTELFFDWRSQDVPAWAVPVLERKVAAVNRRAERAGIAGRYTVAVEPYEEAYKDDAGLPHVRHMAHTTVLGDLLKVEGFTFAATIDWSLGQPLLRRNPDLPEAMVITAPASKRCDHCGTARSRIDTYLVIDETSGQLTQVGRNCLAAYCGLQPGWVSLATDESMRYDAEGWGGGREYFTVTVQDALAIALAIVEYDGSYKPAAFENDATKGKWWLVMGETIYNRHEPDPVQKAYREYVKEHLDEHQPAACELVEWMRALDADSDNDFLYNLHTIGMVTSIGSRHVGLCLAAIPAHDKEVIRRQEASERGPVPTGSAITIEGVIEKLWEREDEWGIQWKLWLRLDNGSRVYSTAPQALLDLLRTDTTSMTGRVIGWQQENAEGKRIALTANVEAAHDDPTTGFAKRPRKPVIIDTEEVAS